MIDNNKQKGFSLIETIVYLAIVGILLTATVALHLTLSGTSDKLANNILVSRNRRVALSSIDYLVKNSDGLLRDLRSTCSDIGSTPPVLALYFDDDTYLPGICVGDGGGVKISVSDKHITLTCYPNIPTNGSYQACNTSVYPAENVYYLSSPDVEIFDNSLSFATSTATSSANNFLSVTSKLSVGTPYNDQIRLGATSTASSTAVIRNEQASGLISWWEIALAGVFVADSYGSNSLACYYPDPYTALISGSDYSLDFISANNDYCRVVDDESLNFNDSFSITAWVNEDTTGVDKALISKINTEAKKGYGLYIDNGYAMLRICDTNTCADYNDTGQLLANGSTYHITATYDLSGDEAAIYVYKKAVGGQATSTFHSLNTLVNYNGYLLFSTSTAAYTFDGRIDDVRIYNKALSPEEIWAIQSQGAS